MECNTGLKLVNLQSNIYDKLFLEIQLTAEGRKLFLQKSSSLMFNRVLTVKSGKYRCLKRVQIRSFSCRYFPVLELNQKNSEKLRTRKTIRTIFTQCMCLEISLEIEFLNSYPWKAPLMQKHNISINLTELDFDGIAFILWKTRTNRFW